jgi:hypothetical protein
MESLGAYEPLFSKDKKGVKRSEKSEFVFLPNLRQSAKIRVPGLLLFAAKSG